MEHYDIFISYKRKSLPTANNLYYRLTTRGYSTFFDLEEMRRDNFNIQLLNYIENAKDVFVILEEGSLDGCKKDNWEDEDWFCHEIAFALEKKKNIIPILLGDYKMPSVDFFPDKLKELSLKHSPDFSFSFFDAYLDKLIEKKFITSEAHAQNKATSVFKFYSNENCQVFKEGKLVCSLEGMSDEPYYLPVPRKGDYRFKVINNTTNETRIKIESIDVREEKTIEIKWNNGWNNTLYRGNRKGCSMIIGLALLVVIVFLLMRLWRTSYEGNTPIGDVQSEQFPSNLQSPQSNYPEIDEEKDDDDMGKERQSHESSYSKKGYKTYYENMEEEGTISLTSEDIVDLGLSVNWASRNVGAANPEDAGGYYAWGETKEKDEYTIESYQYKYSEYGYTQTKRIASDISGTKYDVARLRLGNNYRMPTREELKELILECDWHYGKINGTSGMVVTGRNGNRIFIPAVGNKENMSTGRVSYYWTSTADEYGTPYCLHISAFARESKYDLINHISVEHGLPIRPVVSK